MEEEMTAKGSMRFGETVVWSKDDARELITGEWERALRCYQRVLGHTGSVDACLESALLVLRADYLYLQQGYEAHTWLTAHVRAFLWVRSRPGERVPVHLHPTTALTLNDRRIPDTRQHVLALQGDSTAATEKNNLLHLLGKGLPRRCQIRELSRFLGNYLTMGSETECAVAISRMFVCTLVGLYPHSKCQPPMDLTATLVASIALDPASSTDVFATWLRGNSQSQSQRNQSLSLCVIREHLCAVVSSMPDIAKLLRKRCNWLQFERETLFACEYIRGRLFEYVAEASTSGGFSSAVYSALDQVNSGLAGVLHRLKQSTDTGPSVVGLNSTADRFPSALTKAFSGLRAEQMKRASESSHRNMLCMQEAATKACQTVPATEKGVVQRLRHLQAPPTFLQLTNALMTECHRGATVATVKAALLALLQVDVYFYTALEYELRSAAAQLNTGVYTLPRAHFERQTVALEIAWKDVAALNACPHNGCMFVCMSCQTIANTVSEPPTDSRRRTHVPNIASLKVAVDDDACRLMCARSHNGGGQSVRAHKMLKTELGSACSDVLPSIQGDAYVSKLNPVTFQSLSVTLKCNSVPLSIIPLYGNLVAHGNGLYKLCEQCARVMRVCEQFRYTCYWCKKQEREVATSTMHCAVCSKSVSSGNHDAYLFSNEFESPLVSSKPVCGACVSVCNGQKKGVLDLVHTRKLCSEKKLRKELRVCSTNGFSKLPSQ